MNNDSWVYDVIVIGAGIAGAAVSRELARLDASVLVLETGNDIACGATRANSAIVHAGFDPEPGTLKARFNAEGSKLYPVWAEELGFPYRRNGSMVLAFSDEDVSTLEELVLRARENGIDDVRLLSGEEACALEPAVSSDVKAALLAETGAICDPYLAALRCVECAIANGVELRLNEEVLDIQRGYGRYLVRTSAGELYRSRVVVNAAGVFADKINNMVSDHRLHIVPRRGDYQLFDTDFGDFFPIPCFRFLPGKAREFW